MDFRCGNDALDAHFQQAVFFCLDGSDIILNALGVLDVVMFIRGRLDRFDQGVDDGRLILGQLVEYAGHDLIQLCGPQCSGPPPP